MKIRYILSLAMLVPCAAMAKERADDTTSKTFFSANPQYTTGRPEHLSLYRYERMVEREDGCEASFQIVGLGGKSTNSNGLARYFFPYQKSSLVVAESPNPTPGTGGFFSGGSESFQNDTYDLLARNFNIETVDSNFESVISIRPQQSFGGAALNYSQMLTHCNNKGFWFDVTVPIIQVKNWVHLDERITSSSTPLTGTSANMRAAFMNPAWQYGKIAPCPLKKTGVGDAEIRFGLEVINEEIASFGGFIGFSIPGGNRPHARYMFEPLIGRNGHWGLIWGSSTSIDVWETECSNIYWNLDINNNYIFEATERRSFDLRDKSWSRYMNLFADSTATTTIPGINVLTAKMKISPQATFQINSAFTFDWRSHFQFEGGTWLYARMAEDGRLCGPWVEGPGIAGTKPATTTPATTMSNATMQMWDYGLINDDADMTSGLLNANPVLDTPVFRPIRFEDLNLDSALHGFCGGVMFYGTLGYQSKDACYPWFAAIGGGYQIGSENSFMQRWSVWGKLGWSI